MNKRISAVIVLALLVNFAGIALYAADEKAPHIKIYRVI
jgi:hypothetical protein